MIGSGGSTSAIFHRFKGADEESPEKKLFKEHIEPDVKGSTFASDVWVKEHQLYQHVFNNVMFSREGLKALGAIQNGALMINYQALLDIKNPCDFEIAWKSGQPE